MKTVLNVKVDPKVKKAAQKVAQEMGLPMSFIVNHFLNDFIRIREITFRTYPMPKKLERRLAKMEKDVDHTQIFPSMERGIAYLHTQIPKKK